MVSLRHLFLRMLFVIMMGIPVYVAAQSFSANDVLLSTLDSISRTDSPAKDFAFIYLKTTIGAKAYFAKSDDSVQALMNRFENRFGYYFLNAANAYKDSIEIPFAWRAYYVKQEISPLRHMLHGINAHINNDLWMALTTEFTFNEIRLLKKSYYSFHRYLRQDYEDVYTYALSSDQGMRRLHMISLGIDRWYGALLLRKWRKRQLQIAELYYTDPKKFQKKRKKVEQKMVTINRLIGFYF